MTVEQPHAKLPHMFVVLRVDRTELDLPIENMVSAVSVFDQRHEAEAEVTRLQALRPEGESHYMVLQTRHKGGNQSAG